jgi:hypothetical protein
VDLKEYLIGAADKIHEAGRIGDRTEALRLLRLVRNVIDLEIRKLDDTNPGPPRR